MPHTYRRVKLRAYKTYYIGTYESQLSTKQAFDKHTKLPVFRAGALAPTHSSLGTVYQDWQIRTPCRAMLITSYYMGVCMCSRHIFFLPDRIGCTE